MDIIDRIFKNKKTTAIGLIILAASIASVFMGKASLTEAGAFIVMGIGFFFLKDKPPGAPTALIFLLLLVSSCGASYHLKKSNYHLRMAKAKGAIVTVDTIYKTIPIITETTVHDTLVLRQSLTDTLFINTTKYSVKLKYDTILKKEYVRVECKGDTIYKEVPVEVPVTVHDNQNRFWKWFFIIGAALLAFAVIVRK